MSVEDPAMAALERLAPLIGEWAVEANFGEDHGGATGRMSFEWALDRAFVVQRGEVDHPQAPNTLAVIGVDADRGAYTQHYFDSRGIARIYAMTFEGGIWGLRRESADFSELPFRQRYLGRLTDDATRIAGRWETSDDGIKWELDFELTYTRVS